jgi:hypothetical protein
MAISGLARAAPWAARLAVGGVFVVNVSCAAAFLWQPQQYAPAFELEGRPGRVMVQAVGLLFLMWNATYPRVLVQPDRRLALFGVILAQQVIGLGGETWLWLRLPPMHPALRDTGLRFILFDGAGLILMSGAFLWLMTVRRAGRRP